MSFPRYPKYKPSGVEWLKEIPEHWEVTTGRRLFEQKREPSYANDKQLSATQKYGVIPQSKFMELEDQKVTLALSGLDNFKHVNADDFVISLRSFQGGIEHSAYEGCVSPAYTILRPQKTVYAPFWKYLFKSKGYIESLQTVTDGIRDGKNISYEQFGKVFVPTPSPTEQIAIATFLDRETSKIDALVAEQRRLIELLKEKRQAVISHAVTKGLNPNAPMKPSGIEWLGEVPEHWEVGKSRFYLSILSGFAFPSDGFSYDETDVRLLRGINVGVSHLKWDEVVYWRRETGDGLDIYEMNAGDIVIGMDRPLIKEGMRVATVRDNDLPCLLLQRVASLKTGPDLLADYYLQLLSSNMFVAHFSPDTTGVSVPHISPEQIYNFIVPIPTFSEQREIIAFLDAETTKLDALTAQAEQAVELLQERRSALISAAVTGKIDVRNLINT